MRCLLLVLISTAGGILFTALLDYLKIQDTFDAAKLILMML